MQHSTPLAARPGEERLRFLRLFARLYSPGHCCEELARHLAAQGARTARPSC